MPSTHVTGLKSGDPVYILRRFDIEAYMKAVERYQITNVGTVPPMAVAMVKSPLAKQGLMKSARKGIVGAAPIDKGVQAQFQSMMDSDSMYTQVWGMTETSCVATMFYWFEHDTTGSIGRPIPNLEMK